GPAGPARHRPHDLAPERAQRVEPAADGGGLAPGPPGQARAVARSRHRPAGHGDRRAHLAADAAGRLRPRVLAAPAGGVRVRQRSGPRGPGRLQRRDVPVRGDPGDARLRRHRAHRHVAADRRAHAGPRRVRADQRRGLLGAPGVPGADPPPLARRPAGAAAARADAGARAVLALTGGHDPAAGGGRPAGRAARGPHPVRGDLLLPRPRRRGVAAGHGRGGAGPGRGGPAVLGRRRALRGPPPGGRDRGLPHRGRRPIPGPARLGARDLGRLRRGPRPAGGHGP
ncbi:MAG: hypothetical protein AVDCRST_MAG61-1723, partial [uncultured Friedmanniella sp.]